MCGYLLSPLILLYDGLEFAGQLAVLLAQLVVAVTVLLDLRLNVHKRALEMSADLLPLHFILPHPLQTLLLQGEREKETCGKHAALRYESNRSSVRWANYVLSLIALCM